MTVTKTKKSKKMEDLLEASLKQYKIYQAGDLVDGKILAVTKNKIWVDIDNGRFVGVISNRELTEEGLSLPDFEIGQEVNGYVVDPELDQGFMLLSIRQALKEKGWKVVEEKFKKDQTFVGKIVEANFGGLMVEADGMRGFLPVSQLSPENYPRVGNNKEEILKKLRELESTNIEVKVLDYDKNVNKLIFSEREAKKEEVAKLIDKVKEGEVVTGKVTGVVDFGIFVALDNHLEGLIHISEVSWDKVSDIGQFAKVGGQVKAMVIGTSEDKVSLSLKRMHKDPWLALAKDYKEGQTVKGKITQIMPFGVFVKIDDKIDGLIHISEISQEHVKDPAEKVSVGKSYDMQIISIEQDSHRLGLSLKALEKPKAGVEGKKPIVKNDVAATELSKLDISAGALGKLQSAGVKSMKDLADKSLEELMEIKGVGKTIAEKILKIVKKK